MKGKAVVIEFWATWCGGCVDNIPHLNELADRFASRSLQFISITDETDVDVVKHFLLRHPMRGWVAFDADESTFNRYGIEGRPQTLLVDGNGVVRAITNPASVTPEVLDDLLAGKHLDFPDVRTGPPGIGTEPGAPLPLVQVLIRPAVPVAVSHVSPGGTSEKDGRYDWYGSTLREILSEAYQIPESRVDAPEWCSTARYDLSVVTPQQGQALRWPLLKQGLEAAFQLKLHTETKDTKVYVLRKIDGQHDKLRVSATQQKSTHWIPGKGVMEAEGATVTTVTRVAEIVLRNEVRDETGLTDRYDFDLNWDANDSTSIVAAIRSQLGLALSIEHRNLDHLVVDSIVEAKTW